MEENFTVYYCSVCHVCKTPSVSPESMKFCSGCKLVQYCSIEHQKRDWASHKGLCKGVQFLVKKNNLVHIYQDARVFGSGELVRWNMLRMAVSDTLKETLKRRLTNLEWQMVLFPPVCSYCHEYKANKMFICYFCKSVLYCSKEHQSQDERHSEACKSLVLAFQTDMFRCHRRSSLFNYIDLANQCGVKKLSENLEKFLKSMTSNVTTREICISETLSFTMTLFYVFSRVAKVSANDLTVHIVGANGNELLAMQTLPLVYHLLPHIIHLNIVIIGPELPVTETIPLCIFDINVSLHSVNSLYHEYVASPDFVTPNVVVAYNCGFCEFVHCPIKDTWKLSLPYLLSFKNTIMIVTSYTKKESEDDLKRVLDLKSKELECKIVMKSNVNPFASLYPHRDWESEGVYYPNKYISVITT